MQSGANLASNEKTENRPAALLRKLGAMQDQVGDEERSLISKAMYMVDTSNTQKCARKVKSSGFHLEKLSSNSTRTRTAALLQKPQGIKEDTRHERDEDRPVQRKVKDTSNTQKCARKVKSTGANPEKLSSTNTRTRTAALLHKPQGIKQDARHDRDQDRPLQREGCGLAGTRLKRCDRTAEATIRNRINLNATGSGSKFAGAKRVHYSSSQVKVVPNAKRRQAWDEARDDTQEDDRPLRKKAKLGASTDSVGRPNPQKSAKNSKTSGCNPEARVVPNNKSKRKTVGAKKKSDKSIKEDMLKLQAIRDDGTWVECTNCKKWRLLDDVKDPSQVAENWICMMNPDQKRNNCKAKEADYNAYVASKDASGKQGRGAFAEVEYTVGSVVWAKFKGYPWWPALVDDDPDTMEYLWTDEGQEKPSWYHVIFIERKGYPVTRAWIRSGDLKSYKIGQRTFNFGVVTSSKSQSDRREEAVLEAERALNMDIDQRRKEFTFVNRFHGKWGKYFNWSQFEPKAKGQP